MKFGPKTLSCVFLVGIPYVFCCGQKTVLDKELKPASVAETDAVKIDNVEKSLDAVVNEEPVFKKVFSDDSSYFSISGYNAAKKENVDFTYNLVSDSVSLSLRSIDCARFSIYANVSYLDKVFSLVEVNGYYLTAVSGERIYFSGGKNIVSPAKNNLNFSDEHFAKADYHAHEKIKFELH